MGNIRVMKNSDLVLTECLSRRILRLTTSPIDLINSERASSSTSSFLAHCLAYTSHASMIISKFLCHKNETGSLNFERTTTLPGFCVPRRRLPRQDTAHLDLAPPHPSPNQPIKPTHYLAAAFLVSDSPAKVSASS